MFKRVFWMSTGMAVGAAGAFWAKRRVEETIEYYLPDHVADRAVSSARQFGETVRAAADEGRQAMRETEAQLRARVDDRTFVGQRPEPPRPAPPRSTQHLRARRYRSGGHR